VCSPTRASILTGKYPARLGVTNFIGQEPARGVLVDAPYIDHLPLAEKNLAATLGEAGWSTWHVGKWHLGAESYWPDRQGFEKNIGGCGWGYPQQGYFSPWGIPTLPDGIEGQYLTDRLTDEAIALIRSGAEPFFLFLPYYAVHIPIESKTHLVEKYKRKAASMGLDKVKVFEEGGFFPCEHKRSKRIVRRIVQSDPAYAAMIETLDSNIGRLLSALEETGQADNTTVIFTSDNGGLATAEGSPTCNSPLAEGKGWMYEGGTREPLVVKWPGITRAGSSSAVPVTSPDFYPTILEMTGLDLLPEQHVDGESLVPLLKGETDLQRSAIYWHYPHYGNQGGTPGCALRSGDWKLIEFFEDSRLELYNLREDCGETNNLAAKDPQRTQRMQAQLIEWRESIGAQLPQPNPEFKPRPNT
jgi:arylsulfatase A-like enzyme